jgi:hypothetical protein
MSYCGVCTLLGFSGYAPRESTSEEPYSHYEVLRTWDWRTFAESAIFFPVVCMGVSLDLVYPTFGDKIGLSNFYN